MNGSNIQNHSLMLSEYLHNIQYIDITIPSNSIGRVSKSLFQWSFIALVLSPSEKKVPPIIRDKFLIIGSEKAQNVNTVVVYANEHFVHPCLKLIDPNVKIHEGRSAGCKAQYKTPNFCYGYEIIENPR